MLHLNKTIIPDPDAPVALDVYGDETGPGLVVYTVKGLERFASGQLQPMSNATLVCAYRGAAVSMPYGMLPAFVVSIGFRPLGRLERRERGVKPRPEDFDLAAAVNDLGPRLRALREQTGLRIGEFARALGCPLPALSRIELGEWVPGPQGLNRGAFDVSKSAQLAADLADALLRAGDIKSGSGQAAEATLFAALNPERPPACKSCGGAGGWSNSMSDPGTSCPACCGTGVAKVLNPESTPSSEQP